MRAETAFRAAADIRLVRFVTCVAARTTVRRVGSFSSGNVRSIAIISARNRSMACPAPTLARSLSFSALSPFPAGLAMSPPLPAPSLTELPLPPQPVAADREPNRSEFCASPHQTAHHRAAPYHRRFVDARLSHAESRPRRIHRLFCKWFGSAQGSPRCGDVATRAAADRHGTRVALAPGKDGLSRLVTSARRFVATLRLASSHDR